MNFDMNAAWSRAIELVKENFQLLVIVAAVLVLLPGLAIALLMPNYVALSDPGADPEVLLAQLSENAGTLIAIGIVGSLVQFAGSGALIALMGPKRPTVGQAIVNGVMVAPSTLVVFVLFFVLYFIAAMVVVVPISIIAGVLGAPALAGLAVIFILPIIAYLFARMSMSLPVLVLEETLNPFTAITRSFKLTHKKQWPITIFWTVLGVLYLVIALLFSGGMGAIAALAGGGTVSALILGLTNGVFSVAVSLIMCGLAVAIHQQLAGPDDDEVASVFG